MPERVTKALAAACALDLGARSTAVELRLPAFPPLHQASADGFHDAELDALQLETLAVGSHMVDLTDRSVVLRLYSISWGPLATP
jgi:hypothetical protein